MLDSSVDPRLPANNRPALAQTFTELEAGGEVTVVVNHLKSKGSACTAFGDPDTGDGQGNCNLTRTLAAEALVDWLASDPTGQGTVGRELIIGDLNSYDHEDPIDVLRAAGYTDLLLRDQGEFEYSYNFDGELGYLDYALAGAALAERRDQAAAWHINSDESALYDYNVEFKNAALQALWAPDPYRSSDHDPVVVGLDLTPPDTTAPTLELTASTRRSSSRRTRSCARSRSTSMRRMTSGTGRGRSPRCDRPRVAEGRGASRSRRTSSGWGGAGRRLHVHVRGAGRRGEHDDEEHRGRRREGVAVTPAARRTGGRRAARHAAASGEPSSPSVTAPRRGCRAAMAARHPSSHAVTGATGSQKLVTRSPSTSPTFVGSVAS